MSEKSDIADESGQNNVHGSGVSTKPRTQF
jgi:hypothetical protein